MNNELKHFGVLGMKWGRSLHRKAAEGHRNDAELYTALSKKQKSVSGKMSYKKAAKRSAQFANKEEALVRVLDKKIKAKELVAAANKKKMAEIRARDISGGKVVLSVLLVGPLGTVAVNALAPSLLRKNPDK